MKKIKLIPKKDLKQFVDLGVDSFPGMDIHTEAERKNLLEGLKKRYDCQSTNFWGMYEGSNLTGGIIYYDYTMNLFGHKVPIGGGGFLAVGLLNKKEHIARDLCLHFFKHYRKLNSPFTILWPFRPDFYRKMGAGMGGKNSIYRFKPEQLPSGKSKKHLRNLVKSDLNKVIDCFNRFADSRNGMVYDFKDYRRFKFIPGGKMRYVGYEKNSKLEGFMSFVFEKGSKPDFLDHVLRIDELIYNTPEALHELMTYLQTQADQVPLILYTTSDEMFHFFMNDPRIESGALHPPVYHETNLQVVGIMYRLINNRLLFELLHYHSFNDETLRLKLNITDNFLKENNKPLTVYFDNGYPTLKKSNAPVDVILDIDIADFSSLVLGAVDLKSLYTYGMVKISKVSYLDQLHNLFKTDQKPLCLTQF